MDQAWKPAQTSNLFYFLFYFPCILHINSLTNSLLGNFEIWIHEIKALS